MVVIFNVKITDIRMGFPYTRGEWMPNPPRMDIFKYCLASTAALEPLVSKFIFCITVAPELLYRQEEMDEYIRSLFPAEKLVIVPQRCDYGRDWKLICDEYLTDPEEIVWLAANDDHIFIDSNLDLVEEAIDTLKADPDPHAVMYYSHWPEQMRMSVYQGGQLTKSKNFVKFTWETFDGIMMLKAGRLKQYWERDYGNALMFKPDYLGAHHGYECMGNVYAPTRELVRHYEGYSHVGSYVANIAPPLFIPPGFFENDIKIAIGFKDRDDSWTNFNPISEWVYNVSPGGTDYRWVEEDIPLFWKNRLGKVTHAPDYDRELNYQARDAAFLAATRVPMKCFNIVFTNERTAPKEWFTNHLLSAKL